MTIRSILPIPSHCDNCCSVNVEFKEDGRIYFCLDCEAAVSCHKGTSIPLGRMADRVTRQLRIKAHDEFDRLWKSGLMSREKAYDWLSKVLEIDPTQCHISWLTKAQLSQVIRQSSEYLTLNQNALLRRKGKQDAKRRRQEASDDEQQRKQRQQTAEHIRRRKAKR